MPALVQVTVKVIDWSLSIVAGEEMVTAVPVNWELTMTVTALEVTETGVEALSFTCSSNDQVPIVDRVPVETVGLSPVLQANEEPRAL